MANGLLAGIGSALTAGTQSFQQAREMRMRQEQQEADRKRADEELKLRNQQFGLEARKSGFRPDENGNLIYDESIIPKDPMAELKKQETILGIEGKRLSNRKLAKELKGGDNKGLLVNAETIKAESDLRSELTKDPRTKAIVEVDAAAKSISNAMKNPSPAGDISLLVGFMKLIDPGSTVREGEFATAQQAGGVPTQILATYNRMLRGERLTEQQRQDFARQAGALYNSRYEQFAPARAQAEALAKQYGVDPSRVIGGYSEFKRFEPEPDQRELARQELERRRSLAGNRNAKGLLDVEGNAR